MDELRHIIPFLFFVYFCSPLYGNSNLLSDEKTFKILYTDSPPNIDGVADEEVWKGALKLTGFFQIEPDEGIPSSEETEVYLTYSKSSLYLLFIAHDSSPSLIRTSVCPRDEIFETSNDIIGFYLDSYHDRRRAFAFFMNPSGIQADGIHVDGKGDDFTFDTIFYSKGKIDEKGYVVEVAIPFKSLRFKPADEIEFGFIAIRKIARKGETVAFPRLTKNSATIMGQGVTIKGFKGINPGRSIELLPSLTFSNSGELVETDEGQEVFSLDPVSWNSFDPGLSIKYGITTNLTLDTAINPDFSQVESDPDRVDVNIRYPLYYEEKRPFFLEGKDSFETPIKILYSRSIVDPLYGIKLTGKVGDTNIGLLNTLDEAPSSSLLSEGWSGEDMDGKKALNTILIIKEDILSNSHIGMIFSDKTLFQGSNPSLYNRVFGLDSKWTFLSNNTLVLSGLYSWTGGGEEKISDPAISLRYSKSMKYSSIIFIHDTLFPDFRAENGFIERVGYSKSTLISFYRFMINRWKLDYIEPTIFYYNTFDHPDYILADNLVRPILTLRLFGTTYLSMNYEFHMERWDEVNYHKDSGSLSIRSEASKNLSFYFVYSQGDKIDYDSTPSYLGYYYSLETGGIFKPHILTYFQINYTKSLFLTEPLGTEIYNFDILRIKNNLNFTSKWSLRTIFEYNSYYEDISLSLLLSFEYNYGTVFYLGYSGKFETPQLKEAERGIFLKLSYLWRI